MSGSLSARLGMAAQLASTVCIGVVSLLSVPLYVRYLGIEAYGIVGLFLTLQLSLSVLDLGLSSTTTREMARLGGDGKAADLLRTLEVIYFGVAFVIVVALLAAAGPLARGWVKPEHLDPAAVDRAFRYMAFAIGASWPASLYTGVLLGRERQVLLSVVNVIASTTKALGIIGLFQVTTPSLDAFFLWQTANSALAVAALAVFAWREVAGSFLRARFRFSLVRSVWQFAAGVTLIDAAALAIVQMDKIVMSALLPLDAFGVYALVSTVVSNVQRVVSAVYVVYYPRLAALFAANDEGGLRAAYREGAESLAALVAPICVVLAVYGREVLVVWTGDPTIAASGYVVMAILVSGRLFHALMHMPAALQLAAGWNALAIVNNVASVVVLAPLVYGLVRVFGPIGVAVAWLVLNVGSLWMVPVMHRRVLPGEGRTWLTSGVLLPTAAALAVALVLRPLLRPDAGRWVLFVEIGAVTAACFLGALVTTPGPRAWVRARLRG